MNQKHPAEGDHIKLAPTIVTSFLLTSTDLSERESNIPKGQKVTYLVNVATIGPKLE